MAERTARSKHVPSTRDEMADNASVADLDAQAPGGVDRLISTHGTLLELQAHPDERVRRDLLWDAHVVNAVVQPEPPPANDEDLHHERRGPRDDQFLRNTAGSDRPARRRSEQFELA